MTVKKFICSEAAGLQRATFPKNELFHGFFFKNFAYFSGITILRNISEWQGSNAVLNHKEQMKDEKRKVIEAKTVKKNKSQK